MKSFSKMVYPYLVWAIIMIVIPMLMIVLYAFTVQGNSVLTFQFTFNNFARFFSDPVFPTVLWRSLKMAFFTTIICIAIGYPTAYIIAKHKPNKQAVMVLLITLPMWINMLVRTYAWRGILSHMHASAETKVYVGMVYNFLPFMILQIYTALSKIDPALIVAAHDLGADDKETFKRVNGMTVTRYVQGKRVSQAELLLRQNDLSIEQVARAVGYSCPSHFSALFKREVGMLPSEFRKTTGTR